MAANGSLLLCWAPLLKLKLIYDQRWKQRKLVWEECSRSDSRDTLFHFLPVKVSWSSADLHCLKPHPLLRQELQISYSSLHLLGDFSSSIPQLEVSVCITWEQPRARVSHLWPADVSSRRKAEVLSSSGLFSLMTERLMLHSSQCTMTTYNVLFEVSDLYKNTLQNRTVKKTPVLIKAFMPLFFFMLHSSYKTKS